MATEGYKKRDIQRKVQKVHLGTNTSSNILDATTVTDRVELGFPAEKITLVTTGDLAADVLPKIGNSNSHTAISVTGTPTTVTTSNMFSSVEITRTGGSGQVLILAK